MYVGRLHGLHKKSIEIYSAELGQILQEEGGNERAKKTIQQNFYRIDLRFQEKDEAKKT